MATAFEDRNPYATFSNNEAIFLGNKLCLFYSSPAAYVLIEVSTQLVNNDSSFMTSYLTT